MEQRSHQTGTPLSQNGTSLLLPLNETAFSDFGTPATLFSYSGTAISVSGTAAFHNGTRFSFGGPTLSLNGTTVFPSGTTVPQNGTSLSLERSGSILFFHERRLCPKREEGCSCRSQRSFMIEGDGAVILIFMEPADASALPSEATKISSCTLKRLADNGVCKLFFSIWRDYVERFKYPKRSVERPCSRHLS